RLHEEEGVSLPAASRVSLVDAAAADASGGSSAVPRLLTTARDLGFRTVAVIDHDGDDADAQAVLDRNLTCADAVVRLPKGYAIERVLVDGLDDAVIRDALKQLQAAFGLSLPVKV